jgi:hypothetical protein
MGWKVWVQPLNRITIPCPLAGSRSDQREVGATKTQIRRYDMIMEGRNEEGDRAGPWRIWISSFSCHSPKTLFLGSGSKKGVSNTITI